MPILRFNLSECGSFIEDDEGLDVPDLNAARAIAFKAAREIMGAEVREGRLCLSCRIDVINDAGAVVVTVPFSQAVTITGQA